MECVCTCGVHRQENSERFGALLWRPRLLLADLRTIGGHPSRTSELPRPFHGFCFFLVGRADERRRDHAVRKTGLCLLGMVAPRAAHACFSTYGITRERRLWATPKHTMSSRSSRPSLTSLHDAARKGDSRSLQRLITIIDPTAAKKVAAVFLQRHSGKATCTPSAGTDPSLGKKVQGHITSVTVAVKSYCTPAGIHVLNFFNFSN